MSISPVSAGFIVRDYSSGSATIGAEPMMAETGGHRPLNQEEQQQVVELKRRDTEVRAHESAHIAAGGACIRGGPDFEYETGPDGKRYAVGGEVAIDSSPVSGNPQATITKMQTVRRAALAPAQPSGQDQSVASQATANEMKARQELSKQKLQEAASPIEGNSQTQVTEKSSETRHQPRIFQSAVSAYTGTAAPASTSPMPHFDFTA